MNAVTIPENVLRVLLMVATERCPARFLSDDELDALDAAMDTALAALSDPVTAGDVIGRVAS